MNKLFLKVGAIVLGAGLVVGSGVAIAAHKESFKAASAAEIINYSLIPTTTGGNSSPHNDYTKAATTEISGITWSVTGNSSYAPWRIGGKKASTSDPAMTADRTVFSKNAITTDISKVVLTHGTSSGSITVNSLTLIVSTAEDGGGTVTDTVSGTYSDSTPTTFSRPSGHNWAGKYFKFVYNITVNQTKNKYIEFSRADFYEISSNAGLTVDKESATIKEGDSLTLTATPDGGTGDVSWVSSDPSVVSVSAATGNSISITGEAAGSASITVSYSTAADVVIPVSVFELDHAGTVADPYSVSDALKLIGSDSNDSNAMVYTHGFISAIKSVDTTEFFNAEFSVSDDGTMTDELVAFRLKYLDNANFESADQINVGDEVVLYGKLTEYNSTKEVTSGYIYSQVKKEAEAGAATINFGNATGSTKIDGVSVTGNDSLSNEWTITVDMEQTSFTQNAAYSQVGSSSKPATSILLSMSLDKAYTIKAFSAKFGGFSGTAGDISLKVGTTEVGTGALDATNDVVAEMTSTNPKGSSLSVEVTNIAKGVKVYYVSYTLQIEAKTAAEYATEFLSVLSTGEGAVCKADGSTVLADLKAAWKTLADEFSAMSDTDKALFTGGTAGTTTDIEKVLTLYDYIATKYNTRLESASLANYNFMGRTIVPHSNHIDMIGNGNNVALIVILSSSIAVISAVALVFVLKRKKHN